MKKLLTFVFSFLLIVSGFAPAAFGQANLRTPVISAAATGLTITYTAGTVNNGGHPVAITAGTASATTNKTDCSSPGFANCNFLYANSTGTVAITTTLATAVAPGNTLMALIETTAGGNVSQIVYPLQSGTLWMQAAGPLQTGFSSAPTPAVAGATQLGTNALPWGGLFLGTAATNNINILPLATAAARTEVLADPGATGAFAIADPSVNTKVLVFDISGMTAAKTLTLASNSANSRTITFTDPGGAANVAYANPTTAQALTALSSITSSGTNPATAGVVRLANTELLEWRDAANGSNITLGVNGSNNLVLTGATAPTDGYYFVPPEQCHIALTTGTYAANPANCGGASAPGVCRAASGNPVLQLTTTAAANTTDMVCDITPPSRLTAGKGVTITAVDYLFGYQTTALTSIGTAVPNSVTYGAAGAAAQGTVASIGGALTVTAGTSHGTPGATTTGGQCYHESISFGTPYAVVVDSTRLTLQNTFVQSAAAATVLQICGAIVKYSNINGL